MMLEELEEEEVNKEPNIVKCKNCGKLTPDSYFDMSEDTSIGGYYCADCYRLPIRGQKIFTVIGIQIFVLIAIIFIFVYVIVFLK